MNNIVITDVFGNKVSRNKMDNMPFIIAHTDKPDLSIDKMGLSQFTLLSINAKNIILVNNHPSISRHPIDYAKVGLNVWKPIPPKGYRTLNNIMSTMKPSVEDVRTINKNFVSKSNVVGKYYRVNKNKVSKYTSKIEEDSWMPIYGKNVTLLEPENPWYINGKYGNIDKKNDSINKKDDDEHTDSPPTPMESSSDLENNSPNEEFEPNTKKSGYNFNLIACTLLMIVVLLIFIRAIINWRRSRSNSYH